MSVGKADVTLQTRCEALNNSQNAAGKTSQQKERWSRLDDIRLIDRYIEGVAHVLVLFRCGISPDFVACLQSHVPASEPDIRIFPPTLARGATTALIASRLAISLGVIVWPTFADARVSSILCLSMMSS